MTTTTTTTGTLTHLDPATLVIGANVRTDTRLDPALVASVKARGVLEPIVAYADEDGQHVVLYGQRRTAAAVEAKRPTVPVMIVPRPAETDRLVDQLAENDHRAGVTAAERIAAVEQMSLLGMSAAQIAKQTALPKAQVTDALTISKAPSAVEAVAAESLTIEQAVVLAEFEGDEEATAALLSASSWNFAHTAQCHRDRRDAAALIAAETERLTGEGITVITDDTDTTDGSGKDAERLVDLVDAETGEDIDAQAHTACPGHAIRLSAGRRRVYVDAETGQIAADQDAAEAANDAAYDQADDEDGDEDGEVAPPYVDEVRMVAQAVAVCLDPTSHGHRPRYARTSTTGAPATEADIAAEKEAKRAERRRVIEGNKAWDAAEVVRRDWLRTFAQRKTAPKGAAAYLARAIAYDTHALSDTKRISLVSDVLGTGHGYYSVGSAFDAEQVAKATEGRAQHLALVQALLAHEAQTGRQTWRDPARMDRIYLTALKAWGYNPSDIEEQTAAEPEQPTTK